MADQTEDSSVLARLAEPLLASGLWLVVLTEGSFDTIAQQFCDLLALGCRQHLIVCSNRGREVLTFDERGDAVPRLGRIANSNEDPAVTDNADALRWVQRQQLDQLGIPNDATLIVGDELGLVGGLPVREIRARVGLGRAVVVSTGVQPEESASDVAYIGGGRRMLREVLAARLALQCASTMDISADDLPAPTLDPDDRALSVLAPGAETAGMPESEIVVHGVRPELEHVVESWLTVSNGFLGVRGALEDPNPGSRPRTLVAGLYGPVPADAEILSGLVPVPNWTPIRLIVGGERIALGQPEHQEEEPTRVLDTQHAVLRSRWSDLATPTGSVTVDSFRLVSQARRQIGIQIIRIEVSEPSTVVLQSWLDSSATGLMQLDDGADNFSTESVWRTADNGWGVGCASVAGVRSAKGQVVTAVRDCGPAERNRQSWAWDAQPGSPATFVRIVAIERDHLPEVAAEGARARLREASAAGVAALLDEHMQAWRKLWTAGNIEVAGDPEAQRQLRFALFHLLSAANPDDEHVSIGARGLTGDAYLGHVFWDTDVFLVPFYTCAWPAVARSLLMYRFHTLPAARERAAQLGYKGALYAWESTDTGEDVTPTEVLTPDGQRVLITTGTEEQHISADVAFAVWRYWQATGDVSYLFEAGAEILVETARFWASRCKLESDGLYHVRHVIGPDEYHEGVDDNAYTNGMARLNLVVAASVARHLSQHWPGRWSRLAHQLQVEPEEMQRWRVIGKRLAATRHHNSHDPILEQFAGYLGLEYIDLGTYQGRGVPMDVILGAARAQQSQVIKQADVVMLLALLPEEFTRSVRAANYDFYEPRCGHGSSLSPGIHSLVAAQLGLSADAEKYLHQAASIDLNELTVSAAQGLHMAALGSLWMALVQGFAGVALRGEGVRLDPCLPDGWRSLTVPVRWHDAMLEYHVTGDPLRISICLKAGDSPVPVILSTLHHTLHGAGDCWTCSWDESAQTWKEGSTWLAE